MPNTRTNPIPSRLAQARRETGLTQEQVADRSGLSRTSIARYEGGTVGPSPVALNMLATIYGKPVEWFYGEGPDVGIQQEPPAARSDEREGQKLEGIVTAIRAYLSKRAQTKTTDDLSGDEADSQDIERLQAVAAAAGSGAMVYDETTTGRVPFLTSWLREHSITPANCNIISVRGPSMQPTLPDGCSIIVDRKRREPVEDRIYVMRMEDGLVVKRLGLDEEGRWEARSDNPDWEPKLLTYGSDIVGEVRWSGHTY